MDDYLFHPHSIDYRMSSLLFKPLERAGENYTHTRGLLTQSCVGADKLLLFSLPFHLFHCQVPFLNLNQPMMLSSKAVNDYCHFPG